MGSTELCGAGRAGMLKSCASGSSSICESAQVASAGG
jgi:hypothetical protein